MALLRKAGDGSYTVVRNHCLRNKKLSLKAKGMYALIVSLPPNWNFSITGLAGICTDGVSSISAALLELEKSQYIVRGRVRREDGKLGEAIYTIFDEPCTEEQRQEAQAPLVQIRRRREIVTDDDTREEHEPDEPEAEKPIFENPR